MYFLQTLSEKAGFPVEDFQFVQSPFFLFDMENTDKEAPLFPASFYTFQAMFFSRGQTLSFFLFPHPQIHQPVDIHTPVPSASMGDLCFSYKNKSTETVYV